MENTLEINQLEFSWKKGGDPFLKISDFSLGKKEKLFLQGPSGSGKSTLLNLIAGILPLSNGEIKVLDQKLSSLSPKKKDRVRGNHMGYIFQMFNLVPYLSVTDNVLLPLRFSPEKQKKISAKTKVSPKDEVLRLLEALNLSSDISESKASDISVGQAQRVAAVRALIGSPEIVIADEPTSSLDTDNQNSFCELLFKEVERAGSSLLFVSHDERLKDGFDRVVQLGELQA